MRRSGALVRLCVSLTRGRFREVVFTPRVPSHGLREAGPRKTASVGFSRVQEKQTPFGSAAISDVAATDSTKQTKIAVPPANKIAALLWESVMHR
jgi:hypothetical protein